jgi:hypothetical protein
MLKFRIIFERICKKKIRKIRCDKFILV